MARPKPARPSVRAIYIRPWRIDIVLQPGVHRIVPFRVLAAGATEALASAGAPRPASLTLVLSDDAELAGLNAEHMGEHGPTDVLSFPLLPPSAFPAHPGKGSGHPDRRPVEPEYRTPPRQRTHLGDIVISVERAIAQAADGFGGQTGDVAWSAADEMRLLVVHGVLHICGWDHAHAKERDAMRALEGWLMGPR